MKLIVGGTTGFVAKELIRQALSHPSITSIVALGRRTSDELPNDAKLKQVVCSDFMSWPEDVKMEVSGADACVWTIAVTPSKMKTVSWDTATKICRDYAVTAITTLSKVPRESTSTPQRFLYISGAHAVRDPAKKPWFLGDYCAMRGEAENRVLECAKNSDGAVEACVARPGLIEEPGKFGFLQKIQLAVICWLIGLPRVNIREIAATLLAQSVDGFEKEPLLNEDLVRIGKKELEAQKQK